VINFKIKIFNFKCKNRISLHTYQIKVKK